jgi:DnaK suppressor protein
MNQKRLDQYKKMLLDRRQELAADLQQKTAQERDRDNFTVGDSVDEAEASFELDFDLTMKENMVRQIKEIDEALERLREGTFGTCENCGEDIPQDRLRVKPNARFCIRCKSEMERRGGTA